MGPVLYGLLYIMVQLLLGIIIVWLIVLGRPLVELIVDSSGSRKPFLPSWQNDNTAAQCCVG
jgi:hypothetical protein